MDALFTNLREKVTVWRSSVFECPAYPVIAEILEFQVQQETGAPRFLRQAQIRALETYWYLRVVENTPHVLVLYRKLFPKKADLIKALGVPQPAFEACDFEVDDLLAEFAAMTTSSETSSWNRSARR